MTSMAPEWRIEEGLLEYPAALAEMQARVAAIRAGTATDCVWLVEHPPLYTAGTSAKSQELTDPTRFPTFSAGRGGQWTYHGPGQRTAYVMLDLTRPHGRVPVQDIRCYVNGLEEWLIRTLDRFNVKGERREGRVGIWIANPITGAEAKIGAIGVRVTRWVSWHGIALNVAPNLEHFGGIVPCGLPHYGVTSLAALGIPATMHDADVALRGAWDEVLACTGLLRHAELSSMTAAETNGLIAPRPGAKRDDSKGKPGYTDGVNPSIALPNAPSVVAGHGIAAILTLDGEVLVLPTAQAAELLRTLPPPILVHAPATFRRLGLRPGPAFDLLDLFAFVCPAQTAAPTPRGLCLALDDDPPPVGLEAEVTRLPDLAALLLNQLAQGRATLLNRDAGVLAARMQKAGWGWGGYVTHALGRADAASSNEPLKVWKQLPDWEDSAPLPPPSSHPVSEAEARTRLAAMLGPNAEQRPGQGDYAGAATAAFAPREIRGDPHVVLAEAGTGTGKTLGYLAPASVWAEKNKGAVWISTFTRHLQRQIDSELERMIPDPTERRRRVVVRKGRENYLCLLNLEDAVGSASGGFMNQNVIPLGLIARWAMVTDDGDIQGGDLPGWLPELFGGTLITSLADRRGECIHAACPHWRRCFIEHTIRRSRTAELVVANHALVMTQAAWGGLDDNVVPTRYVFDEGHHVFDAADSAFSAALSGGETAELRRWLRGAEGGRSRARGLRKRLDDLVADRPNLEAPLDAAIQAASALPPSDWASRMQADDAELNGVEPARPNPSEAFLRLIRRQILARTVGSDSRAVVGAPAFGSIECDVFPLNEDAAGAADRLARALSRISEPLATLRERLIARLDDEAEDLDEATRNRIEAIGRSLTRRALNPLQAWQAMLWSLTEPQPDPGQRPGHVLFLRLDRRDGLRDQDVGLHRHWLDPTIPFAATLASPAQGLLITSATLRDAGDRDPELSWASAEARVGAPHLPSPAIRASVASPFDYGQQTRAFVVSDVASGNMDQLAAAYRALFLASEGGGLGLFTAISRLRAVHSRIAPDLAQAGIPLYAQHVDAMGNATLVDIFRAEEESCLLGTDAMRDGVDVPGNALRLVVFERTPWPRPDILHRERRVHLSDGDPKGYDDRIVRLRLRQAFGRLIRRASDRGVFVLLDRQAPSRLMSAFPAGVVVQRVGLAQAVHETGAFLRTRAFLASRSPA